MQLSKLNDWLKLAASIGVLAGIIFLAQELNQNNDLAQAESVRELWRDNSEIKKFELTSDIPILFIKSIEHPQDLTDFEIDRLDNYFAMVMNHHLSVALMEKRYRLALGSIDEEAGGIAEEYFGGRFGRAWFKENERWLKLWAPDFIAALAREIENTPIQTTYDLPDTIRSRMEAASN